MHSVSVSLVRVFAGVVQIFYICANVLFNSSSSDDISSSGYGFVFFSPFLNQALVYGF